MTTIRSCPSLAFLESVLCKTQASRARWMYKNSKFVNYHPFRFGIPKGRLVEGVYLAY